MSPLAETSILPGSFRLDGRLVVLTGASSGIGRHAVTGLVESGATVVVSARRAGPLDELRDIHGSSVIPVRCDVTDAGDREHLITVAVEHGGVDVLVNNAGGAETRSALDGDTDSFTRTLNINLTSVFALSAAAARTMAAGGGGSIVTIASILGLVAAAPIPHVAYCAAKGGVVAMTRQLACEWARHGIRVNAIAPGWFPTELTSTMLTDKDSQRWLTRNTPMRRIGRLDELDGPLLLLCSDAGSFVTGQTLAVDGGWTAR